jgi:NAD+ kinase
VISDEARELVKRLPKTPRCPKAKLPLKCDVILIFGGDGTFLSIARHMIEASIPMIGFNLGRLGFLTEISLEKAFTTLEEIIAGKFEIQERGMLDVKILRGKSSEFICPVLNDAVITNADIARVIDLEIVIDGVEVASIRADGLIISTPTGSTAYSLAAGGPIVNPNVEATTITAICPHSLTIRPIVVPSSATIDVKILKKEGPTLLTLDGQAGYDLKPGEIVRVTRYVKHPLKVIRSSTDYFELLRTKLKLGARAEDHGG